MKTILDKSTLEGLIARIKTLQENNTAEWGSMDVGQMIKHCIAWEEMVAGKMRSHRIFLGRIFGKIALKSMIGTDEPVKRNLPTLPELKMTAGVQNFEAGKSKWIALLEQNATSPNNNFIHPFFGKMTIKQIGILSYKHNDHHLRQFNK